MKIGVLRPAFAVTICLMLFACSAKRLLVDTHDDALSRQLLTGDDFGHRLNTGNFDLVRAREGGLNAQVFSVWCGDNFAGGGGFARANREIDSLYALIERNPSRIALAKTPAAMETITKSGRMAAMIGVEGGHMIEDRVDYLDKLADRGMIYMTLTWNNSTSWATSARDQTTKRDSLQHMGLTEFGKQIVRHMNGRGVMVDVSHVGERTFYDVLSASTKPVIASHSCAYTLAPHRRNLKDDQLRALAANGGVVFVNFYSGFVDSTYERKEIDFIRSHHAQTDSLKRIYGEDYGPGMLNTIYPAVAESMRPPLSLLVKHIDYIARLIGVEHVGIGSDFDGSESYPAGLNSVADYPKIAVELRRLGYSRRDIGLIFGGNFLRVWKANL